MKEIEEEGGPLTTKNKHALKLLKMKMDHAQARLQALNCQIKDAKHKEELVKAQIIQMVKPNGNQSNQKGMSQI